MKFIIFSTVLSVVSAAAIYGSAPASDSASSSVHGAVPAAASAYPYAGYPFSPFPFAPYPNPWENYIDSPFEHYPHHHHHHGHHHGPEPILV